MQARVHPSIEYQFMGTNITYNALKGPNCGKVAVTIDNDPDSTEIVDLYNSTASYQDVYSHVFNGIPSNHTITIDALDDKNIASTGKRITLNEFRARPSVFGQFMGDFLNLKLVGTPNSGQAELFVDGNLVTTLDMYSANSSFYSESFEGFGPGQHTFELRATNNKYVHSSGTRINFDGFTTDRALYNLDVPGYSGSIKYFADKDKSYGIAEVFLNGVYQGDFDLYSPTPQGSQLIATFDGLGPATHKLEIIPRGRKNGNSNVPAPAGHFINVDFFELDGGCSTGHCYQ